MVFIKKRLSTSLLITVTLCLGFLYANVQAASTLSNWYTDNFQKEEEEISSTVETGIWTSFKQLGAFMGEAKKDASIEIEESRKKKLDESKANIEALVTGLKEQIDQTVTDLEKESLDGIVNSRNIEDEIEQDVTTILAEILGE
ncbi:hypothetical protein J4G37_36475 [Microvirga sp. 3-52]|nr:hypothetical protein [Microvirga sp. 3-52]